VKQRTVDNEQLAAKAPLRGTQSFVGVMVDVWKRPALTGIEIAWRWLAWVPMAAVLAVLLGGLGFGVSFHPEVLSSFSLFRPVQGIAALDLFLGGLHPLVGPIARWWWVALGVVWLVAASVGRTANLRRLDAGLVARRLDFWLLSVLRSLSLLLVLLVWGGGCRWVIEAMVLRPAARGEDANLVMAFALVVSATLVLFVLWCTVSWILQLAPLLAMSRNEGVGASLRDALRVGPLRGKLIEINLVMGIVRVSLVVLALVFSACPLPFETVETQGFLVCWWIGVGIFYLVASDYFHVVRSAVYLRLMRAYEIAPETMSPRAEAAS
jgi:hypothetical protein